MTTEDFRPLLSHILEHNDTTEWYEYQIAIDESWHIECQVKCRRMIRKTT